MAGVVHPRNRAKVIVFEGTDGSGKSTMARSVADVLGGGYVSYPTDKYVILRNYLRGDVSLSARAAFHTFLADILNDQDALVGAKNEYIIVDRYVLSTIAYEINGGYDYETRKRIVELSGVIRPDAVVFLDTPIDVCIKRINHRTKSGGTKERYDAKQYLDIVHNNFVKLYDDKFLTPNWIRVSTDGNKSENVDAILKSLESLFAYERDINKTMKS